jgi:hypothetical protein
MEELCGTSYASAQQDLQEVKDFAGSQGFSGDLLWWDVAFWAERLREAKYDLKDEQLRPYFALPNVLDGLFALAKRLFGVDVVPADDQAPVWHKDVRFFQLLQVRRAGGQRVGVRGGGKSGAGCLGGVWGGETVKEVRDVGCMLSIHTAAEACMELGLAGYSMVDLIGSV